MFSKKNSPNSKGANGSANGAGFGKAERTQKPSVPSIISASLSVTGNLVSDGEIQVDGSVTGDIKCDELLIGEDALLLGEITATRVRVHGRVEGQINAESVTLASTAHVKGDVVHQDITIEKGAHVEGHYRHVDGTSVEDDEQRSNIKEILSPVSSTTIPTGDASTTSGSTSSDDTVVTTESTTDRRANA